MGGLGLEGHAGAHWRGEEEDEPRARAWQWTCLPPLQQAGAAGHAWAVRRGDQGCGLQTQSPRPEDESGPVIGARVTCPPREAAHARVRVRAWSLRGLGQPQKPVSGSWAEGRRGPDASLLSPPRGAGGLGGGEPTQPSLQLTPPLTPSPVVCPRRPRRR